MMVVIDDEDAGIAAEKSEEERSLDAVESRGKHRKDKEK